MYTLRKLENGEPQLNVCLGHLYSKVIKETEPELYKRKLQEHRLDDYLDYPDYFGIIVNCENEVIFLKKGCSYYVMTQGGHTFDCIKSLFDK